MFDNKTRTAFVGLLGAEVVRRALVALRNDTNNEEDPGNNNKEDGFVITQENNTEYNKTSGSKAAKVQQKRGSEAHQKTHEEAHPPAYRGGGTLDLTSDDEDEEAGAPKAKSGSLLVNKGGKVRAPKARQGSLSLDAPKANQKTDKAAHHPANWGGRMHRRASEGEDKKAQAPKAKQAKDTEAWLQAKRDYEESPYVAT
jgi:hypothetical protein